MKTIAKSLLLGLIIIGAFLGVLLLTAQIANAGPLRDDKTPASAVRHAVYVAKSSQTVNVNIDKPAGRSLRVVLVGSRGSVLACHQLWKQDAGVFRLKFNVADLADGEYLVRILGKAVAADYMIKLETSKADPTRPISLR